MWNPKRILQLVAGFALFFAGYLVYAHFFGGIDGLPALPQAYWPGVLDTNFRDILPPRENNADHQLRRAFGEECPEAKRSIRLEVAAHNLVLAAQDFTIENGRVKLWPFSMAIFGKARDGGWPEINTVRADVAYLAFDKPVSNVMEIGSRRIIGGELTHDPKKGAGEGSGVTVVNNRGTAQRNDDVSIFTPGPILYDEKTQRVWTENVVLLTDLQSQPKPTTINAVGMDVFLLAENKAPAKPPSGKGRVAGVTGVERILLRSDVNMHMWIDSRSGFLAGGGPPRKPDLKNTEPKKPAAADKAQIVITTQGPFSYELRPDGSDRATFDIAPKPGPGPNQVVVHRINEATGKREQLVCEWLEMQFQRKIGKESASGKPGKRGDEPAVELEIRSARALAKTPGGQVTIASESENLNAFGSELIYDAVARLTTLKGAPEMVAVKDGNKIHARQLQMKMGEKSFQEVIAAGPGRIALLDREKGERHLHARWQDELTSSREGDLDVLVLTGQATFEDQQQGQQIQADRLKVWLEQAAGEPKKPPAAEGEAPRRRPQRLEARGRVTAVSPDMRVRHTELLVIRFQDAPPLHGPPPPFGTSSQATPGQLVSRPRPVETPPSESPLLAEPQAAGVPVKPGPTKKPLEVSAENMEAFVLRSSTRTELDRLICRGSVHVQQEPATTADQEVEIRGETLELTRHPEGNVLAVLGKTAVVKLDKMTIIGPDITINQRTNEAHVVGTGAMTMPSDTSFDGGKLKKPANLTVYWNKAMFFNGNYADFKGGIQAIQESSQLACETLQVYLDRPISFRERARDGEKPKVKQLVCHGNVRIEDKTVENGRVVAHKKLSARELAIDNQDGRITASGPGVVRLLQYGAKGEVLSAAPANPRPPGSAARPQEEQELKLTRVQYSGPMMADNVNKTVSFRDEVEVVHLPANDIDLAVDVDKLPEGGMHLQCQHLKVRSDRDASGKTLQTMEAQKRVQVRAQDFWGRSDVMKFDEAKDQLILEAAEGNVASLYRRKVQGGDYDEIKGKKITYSRQKREHRVEGATGVRGTN